MTQECAAEVHLRALADLSPRSLADAVAPEGAPPMQAHPPANRWSAFTNDELETLWDAVLAWTREGIPSDHPLGDEIRAELARRKDTP